VRALSLFARDRSSSPGRSGRGETASQRDPAHGVARLAQRRVHACPCRGVGGQAAAAAAASSLPRPSSPSESAGPIPGGGPRQPQLPQRPDLLPVGSFPPHVGGTVVTSSGMCT